MTLRYSTHLRNRMYGINTELVTNGTFTGAATGWTLSNGAAYGTNNLLCTPAGSNPTATQVVSVTRGRVYKLSFSTVKAASGSPQVLVKDYADSVTLYDSGAGLADGAHTAYFAVPDTANDTSVKIYLKDIATVGSDTVTYDAVSLIDTTRAFQDLFKNSKIMLFSTTQPASADSASGGAALVTITNNGSATVGLTFQDSVGGVIAKTSSETWSGTIGTSGTAYWYRLCRMEDDGISADASFLYPRVDGTVGSVSGNLITGNTSLTIGATASIPTFSFTFPDSE